MKEKFDVRFLPQAEDDLGEILDYIAEDKPTAAAKLADKFEGVLKLIAHNPLLGRLAREPRLKLLQYRYFPIGNYLIFYQVRSKTVFILRILHGARDYRMIL